MILFENSMEVNVSLYFLTLTRVIKSPAAQNFRLHEIKLKQAINMRVHQLNYNIIALRGN